jgi:transcriptional antiterminator RfaH
VQHWFAVLTKPRAESVAREHLARQGFECRLPRTRRVLRRAEGMREVVEPLFPRYLFLRADPESQDLSRVRSTRGVTALVRRGVEPARVPEPVIAALEARSDAGDGFVRLDPPALAPGAGVRVTQGPFEGMDAVFKARSANERVMLLVRVLGEASTVEVPESHLALQL